jgi:beta-galactosidase
VEGEKLQISFYQESNYLVDEYLIPVGPSKIEIPEIQKGKLELTEDENLIKISGANYSMAINRKTGLLNDVLAHGDTLIKSGPYINFKLPGKRQQYSTIDMADYALNWKCTSFNHSLKDGIIQIRTEGLYDSISAEFNIQIDKNGTVALDYKVLNSPENKMIQEAGIKFVVGNQFNKLSWDRKPYFTMYPDTDLGRSQGEVDLLAKPSLNYREKPKHGWEMDSKNFYYHGLNEELPYANIARGMKENIFSFALSTSNKGKLQVHSEGTQACRFDKLIGQNVLLINDQWDYQSLLWGNYMKMIKTNKEFVGKVLLTIN